MAETKATMSRPVASWISYSFIVSILIINGSLYYSRWITGSQGINQAWYNLSYFGSMILLLAASPAVGAALDRGRSARAIFFVSALLIGALAICLVGLAYDSDIRLKVAGTLIAFALINFFYQLAYIPYRWILPRVKGVDAGSVGKLTSYAQAASSLGDVFGAVLGLLLIQFVFTRSFLPQILRWHIPEMELLFVLAVVFILVFVIAYVRIHHGLSQELLDGSGDYQPLGTIVKNYWKDNWQTVSRSPVLKFYLLAFMFYSDALLTVQLNLPIYLQDRYKFQHLGVVSAFVISLLSAAVAAYWFGKYADKWKLHVVIGSALIIWIGVFELLGFATWYWILWPSMIMAGILFGITWSASSAYVYYLTEKGHLGRSFGLYSAFERCASFIGPILWAVVMFLMNKVRTGRYEIAFSVMSVLILVGLYFLYQSQKSMRDAGKILSQTSDGTATTSST